jgi:hypothetical protein
MVNLTTRYEDNSIKNKFLLIYFGIIPILVFIRYYFIQAET